MLELTLQDGRVVRRIRAGFISSLEDLARFSEDLKKDLRESNGPILVEVWQEPKDRVVFRRRKRPEPMEVKQ